MPTDQVTTSSLLFACADRSALPMIRRDGLAPGTPLYTNLDEPRRRCAQCILVLNDGRVTAPVSTAPGSIVNLNPYVDPAPVTAAGGFVVRRGAEGLEIVLIFRRGVWDLPKGKLDEGESIEECAAREVCEELGIERIAIRRPLGRTVHGYPCDSVYAVKTTHWFAMSTEASAFVPQKKENIERVEWTRLSEARVRLGFETLRRHLDAVVDVLKAAASEP